MAISQSKRGQYLVVNVSGQLNLGTSAELDQHCQALCDQGERHIVLEMSQLQYLSSAGIRSIMLLERRMREVKGMLALCAPSQPARMVLTMAGLLDKLKVVDYFEDLPQ